MLRFNTNRNYIIECKTHWSNSKPDASLTRAKTLFIFFLLQNITTTFIKITILILYRRTFTTRRFQRPIWIVGAIVIANSIGVFVSVCCYCTPIAHSWNPLEVPGRCINEVVATTMFSLTLLITDLIIYTMPMPITWQLEMTTRRKVETTLVFTLGLLYVDSLHGVNERSLLIVMVVSALPELSN